MVRQEVRTTYVCDLCAKNYEELDRHAPGCAVRIPCPEERGWLRVGDLIFCPDHIVSFERRKDTVEFKVTDRPTFA